MASPTPTRPLPPLSDDAHALHKQVHANFHAWVKTNPRVGQRSLCAIGVDDLGPSERRALMDTLIATGYDVREVTYAGKTPEAVFLVERTMLAAPPTTTTTAVRVILDRVQGALSEWISLTRDADRLFVREFSVDDLSLDERLVLMHSLKADGFAVRELTYDTGVPRNAFLVERTLPFEVTKAAASPVVVVVNLDAVVQQVQTFLRVWMHAEPRIGQTFKHNLAVNGLTRAERDVLRSKLVTDGFTVCEFSNDVNPPTRTLFIEYAVPSTGNNSEGEDVSMTTSSSSSSLAAGETPVAKTEVGVAVPSADTLDDQARAAAIVDDANRQFTQWLILANCSLTSSFAMSVDLMGMPDSSRQLVKRLLHASEFQIAERGHDALHIHRLAARSAV